MLLLAYVASHFVNHGLGIVSLEAMETGRHWFIAVWRSPAATALLYFSLIGHMMLSLWGLYARRQLRMRVGEAAQYLLGLAIPVLLLGHIIGTRAVHELAGADDTYAYVLLVIWKFDPSLLYFQIPGMIVAWLHGCIGFHYWLRLKPFYDRVRPGLYAVALVLPILALIGFWQGGREVLALAEDPEWLTAWARSVNQPDAATIARFRNGIDIAVMAFIGLVGATLIGRLARTGYERRHGVVKVSYPGARVVTSPRGPSVLDISRAARIPHASVCGGRGRCSTCRVRIVRGFESLPPPTAEERRVLQRIAAPINVRLACQIYPIDDLAVMPLLPPDASLRSAHPRPALHDGQEHEIVILFADLRGFTEFSEAKLPYDVVFVLNRYFANMGEAVEQAGGRIDKFIGDGVMALFGLDTDIAGASRQAINAAREMSVRLAELNRLLDADLDQPLRMGIGIHAGPAIVGEMGYGRATSMTAIGDTVNTASRIEAMSKEFGCEFVVSEDVVSAAGVDFGAYERREITLRGRSAKIAVWLVPSALDLPPALE